MRLILRSRRAWLVAGTLAVASVADGQDRPQTPADKPADAPVPPGSTDPTPATRREAAAVPSATVPAPRPGNWMKQHEAFLDRAKKGNVDLLFLGDSITAGWRNAPAVWSRYYQPRQAANFGIGGDRTQHILWRLDNGEVDTLHPKVVVLMIGTNNLGSNTEAEVAEGVKAILDRLRSKLPDTKILLLGIFPRGSNRDRTIPSVPPDPRVARINARLAAFDDGKTVKYLDIGVHFLDDAGRVSRATMPDFLHLTPAAYQTWADAIEPTLWDLMEPKSN